MRDSCLANEIIFDDFLHLYLLSFGEKYDILPASLQLADMHCAFIDVDRRSAIDTTRQHLNYFVAINKKAKDY